MMSANQRTKLFVLELIQRRSDKINLMLGNLPTEQRHPLTRDLAALSRTDVPRALDLLRRESTWRRIMPMVVDDGVVVPELDGTVVMEAW